MLNRSASWYRYVAIMSAVMALLMVWAMEGLQELHLTPWLHIPLTVVVLTLMGGGAGLAGAAFLEYRERAVVK